MTWLYIGLSVLTTFIVTTGGAITAAVTEGGNGALPGKGALLVSVIAGIVTASSKLQMYLQPYLPNGKSFGPPK